MKKTYLIQGQVMGSKEKRALFNFEGPEKDFKEVKIIRGYSSAGRAPALQAGGQRFDPAYLHQRVTPRDMTRQKLERAEDAGCHGGKPTKTDNRNGICGKG